MKRFYGFFDDTPHPWADEMTNLMGIVRNIKVKRRNWIRDLVDAGGDGFGILGSDDIGWHLNKTGRLLSSPDFTPFCSQVDEAEDMAMIDSEKCK